MKPEYRYFRQFTHEYKVRADADPTCTEGNMRRDTSVNEEWWPTSLSLWDMTKGNWSGDPTPVEYFPDTPTTPSYRFFRQGKGEWKVQTTDPESTEGNFYRNAETPWLGASHSLSDLLAMGATEVGASEEQVPWWAVATIILTADRTQQIVLGTFQAPTKEEALGLFMTETYAKNPGATVQEPLIQRIP